MENKDGGLEQRVWQRVGACPQREQEDLRPLILLAWEAAAVYRSLTGQCGGRQRQWAQSLYDRAMESLGMLKGIQLLRGGEAGQLRPHPVQKEDLRRTLEKCYHRTNRLGREYMARTLDPEVGGVFRALGDREGENGLILARMLGNLER